MKRGLTLISFEPQRAPEPGAGAGRMGPRGVRACGPGAGRVRAARRSGPEGGRRAPCRGPGPRNADPTARARCLAEMPMKCRWRKTLSSLEGCGRSLGQPSNHLDRPSNHLDRPSNHLDRPDTGIDWFYRDRLSRIDPVPVLFFHVLTTDSFPQTEHWGNRHLSCAVDITSWSN